MVIGSNGEEDNSVDLVFCFEVVCYNWYQETLKIGGRFEDANEIVVV